MTPMPLRRYRAERLLRGQFAALRERVLAAVGGRLRANGIALDAGELEACYAQAWHGLYTELLDGRPIVNPAGWLVVVTYRRAIEEHRQRARHPSAAPGALDGRRATVAEELDFASALDDRIKLRRLLEGLRGRLSVREQQAAALCYLQGLTRAEAAAQMGISPARMRKLMDGSSRGRPGVAGKVAALVETIEQGDWCDAQGSLMRGLALGLLDPDGERHRLAAAHCDQCPACRAYVRSLRGLAALLPPLPWLARWALGGGASAVTRAGAHGAAAGGMSSVSGQAATGHAGALAGATAGPASAGGAGAVLSAGGVAGMSGGGLLLAEGPAGAKLVVGCLVALGVAAGCASLGTHDGPASHGVIHRPARAALRTGAASIGAVGAAPASHLDAGGLDALAAAGPRAAAPVGLAPAARASREFGPEQDLAAAGAASPVAGSRQPSARVASATDASAAVAAPRQDVGAALAQQPAPRREQTQAARSAGAITAEREFLPG